MKKSLRELTDYPDIFYSYWGDFLENENYYPITIIENRNKFAKEYELSPNKMKKRLVIPNWIYEYLKNIEYIDHIECYKDIHGNYIIIFSVYNKITNLYGFKEIYPLYDLNQITYCVKLPPKKELLKKAYIDINGCKININTFY
jgi:hypothetical protein